MKVFKSDAGKKAIYDSYDKLVKMWGVGTEERDLEGSCGKTHVILAGQASNPPLLLFHGVGDNSALMWIKNAAELSRHFRLIAVDTMGGAGRSVPDERYEKDFSLAGWYGDILDSLRLKQVYAAGVSYGAYHCQHLAIRYPERIRKIVGIAGYISATGYGDSKFIGLLKLLKLFLPVAIVPTKKNVMRMGVKFMGPDSGDLLDNPEIGGHFRLLMKHYRTQAQFNHARRTFSREEIESIRDKALFLLGDTDIMANFPEVIRANKDFRLNLKMIKGAGHAVNCTKPREIEAGIINFFLSGNS